jgi:5-methylcytosine-specific restriction enzyme A
VFAADQTYKRSEIHDKYGGNRQRGICPSSQTDNIFIFSGKSGKQHGYRDGWENKDVFSYTGEGQVGDMKFTEGNLRLRDHLKNNKRVWLFEFERKGYVKFVSEVVLFDVDYFETHDRNNDLRVGIKFFFRRAEANLYIRPEDLSPTNFAAEPAPFDIQNLILPNVTERKGLVTSRVGQGAYRKSILHRWEYKCAVTNFSNPKILIASHIVPWKYASDEQRLDVDNGILLSPTFDALFDKHFISFENSGQIILTDSISSQNYSNLKITGKEKIIGLSDRNKNYLEKHRSQIA